jgi:hypothetical protein
MGSLIVGLIHARRMADEETAALAEYYKTNPLLEGLSVPRIRIPEVTIDIPLLIEDHQIGEGGKIEDPKTIATEANLQLQTTSSKNKIKMSPAFHRAFLHEVKIRLAEVKQSGTPALKETVARNVQDAFAEALAKSSIKLTASEKETLSRDLRAKVSTVSIAKRPVASSIVANIKTADVKEKSSDANVVRLRMTLKEEGLEWAVQASESGGVKRSLQPE